MRAPFNTLFGRLFGVLLVAIVLAHALAFFWFHHYGQPPPHRLNSLSSSRTAGWCRCARSTIAPGLAARWCP